jgi:hypothetical protein
MSDMTDLSGAFGKPRKELDRPPVRPLPATKEDMLAGKLTQSTLTLNDHVEQLHIALYGSNPKYDKLLDAVYDEDAVEGSCVIDGSKAAEMIRELARQDNRNPYVADKKLATIVKALNVVLRRYGISRRQRRGMLHGEEGNGSED